MKRQAFLVTIALTTSLALAACGGKQQSSAEQTAETKDKVVVADDKSPKVVSATFGEAVKGLDRKQGFFDLFVEGQSNKVLAALPSPDADGVSLRFIYATGLTAGLGSNPIGLDRGAFDAGVVVAFRRVGDKIVAEQENWKYQASSVNQREKLAVRESFARSFLWTGDIIEVAKGGELLVDLSTFLTRDHFGIASALKPRGGTYKIADDRSMPDAASSLAFPDNVEIDAFLTFTSADPLREAAVTAADGRSITLVQHHSFVRLPAEGFRSRIFDPRTGGIEVAHYDFSSALDAPIVKKWARRFRLERVDPSLESGPVKKPIVFYVDPGAPAQIRDALIEGASWWADAFTEAGFENAYRVEVLPEGAHPFDIRYNMIQWTHRQTRGWSYGGGVSDPRTGEMLKANVILGSQRVRQDRMIFEGLAGADKTGTGEADDPVEIALARIRQLSAHEVGHTLGFAHNFAASSTDRASVMDYPAPYIRPTAAGGLDFSEAYGVGVGAWDKFTTKWLYAEFAESIDEAAALEEIVKDGYAAGLRFVGDREARSIATGHPYGAVWDNGADAVVTLNETMTVRAIALDNFGTRSLKPGQPVSDLNKIIVPIYLYHRYQVAAAAKLVGGLNFTYGLKGDGSRAATPVAAAKQRQALTALMSTLDPAALDLPNAVIGQLTPALGGFGSFSNTGEVMPGRTGPVFDVISAADIAASVTINALLHPDRAARLMAFDRRDSAALGFDELLDILQSKIFSPPASPRQQAISNVIQARFVSSLIELSSNEKAATGVRTAADAKLRTLQARFRPSLLPIDGSNASHHAWLLQRVNAHLNRAAVSVAPSVTALDTPPGSPIGDEGIMETCWHCDGIILN